MEDKIVLPWKEPEKIIHKDSSSSWTWSDESKIWPPMEAEVYGNQFWDKTKEEQA